MKYLAKLNIDSDFFIFFQVPVSKLEPEIQQATNSDIVVYNKGLWIRLHTMVLVNKIAIIGLHTKVDRNFWAF